MRRVAVVGLMALMLSGCSGSGDPTASRSTPSTSPTANVARAGGPTPTLMSSEASFGVAGSGGFVLTYPAGWTLTKSDIWLHYEQIFGYVGTGTGSMTCGSDYIPGAGGTCSEEIDPGLHGVEIKISSVVQVPAPPAPKGLFESILAEDPTAERLTLNGFPAVRQHLGSTPTAARVVRWTIAKASSDNGGLVLTAYLADSNDESEVAAAEGVARSIAFH